MRCRTVVGCLLVLTLTACGLPTRDYLFRARQVTVTTIGGAGAYAQPFGVAVDGFGTVYVADSSAHRICKFAPGETAPTIVAGTGGPGSLDHTKPLQATFNFPRGLAVNAAGTVIYVADASNHVIRTITSAGVTTLGTAGATGYTSSPPLFDTPCQVVLGPSGVLYVADDLNNAIRKIKSGTVSIMAGDPSVAPGATDSPALFAGPTGLAVDSQGTVYVADNGNNLIRKVAPNGTVTTIAGSGGAGYADNANPLLASFSEPNGIAVDAEGNVYVADYTYHIIRMMTLDGGVTTISGSPGQSGMVNGAGSLARFNGPVGLAIDAEGSLYVADSFSNSIRKITFSVLE